MIEFTVSLNSVGQPISIYNYLLVSVSKVEARGTTLLNSNSEFLISFVCCCSLLVLGGGGSIICYCLRISLIKPRYCNIALKYPKYFFPPLHMTPMHIWIKASTQRATEAFILGTQPLEQGCAPKNIANPCIIWQLLEGEFLRKGYSGRVSCPRVLLTQSNGMHVVFYWFIDRYSLFALTREERKETFSSPLNTDATGKTEPVVQNWSSESGSSHLDYWW